MANPLLLYENIFDDSTGTFTSTGTPVAGFPITNVNDWRMGTAYRWKADGTGDQHFDFDAGVGNTLAADTVFIAGHNLGTGGANVRVKSDSFTPPTTAVAGGSLMAPTDDLPFGETFTEQDDRYWRISIGGTPSVAAQIGIITLGRRIDFDAGALMDLDPYQRSSKVDTFVNNNGSPIGMNVRHKTKQFQLNYGRDTGGMRTTSFFTTITPDIDTGWLPHAVDSAKPFWFAWNIAVDTDPYLCHVDGPSVSMPHVGNTNRRGFQTTFTAYRETS